MSGSRSILISGASTGIGEATAHHFASAGWNVFAGVRTASDGDRLGVGGQVAPVLLDVTSDASVATAMELVAEHTGDRGLDVLVNNAGVARGGPLEYLELQEWYDQFEVNLFGVVRLTRAAMPLLRQAVDPRIVMIGSINSRLGAPLLGPYAASKHAMAGLVSSLRAELGEHGPIVTMLEPGAVKTEIWPKAVTTAARLEATLPDEALDRYGHLIAAQKVHLREGQHDGIEPAQVAQIIERSVIARRPSARRLVGRDALAGGTLARVLPGRAMEAVLRLVQRRTVRVSEGSRP